MEANERDRDIYIYSICDSHNERQCAVTMQLYDVRGVVHQIHNVDFDAQIV